MDFICKVEFAEIRSNVSPNISSQRWNRSLGITFVVQVSMMSGSSRTTISELGTIGID